MADSAAPLVIGVPYTHLFRGLRLRLPAAPPGPKLPNEVLLLFADGRSAAAELEPRAGMEGTLHVAAYTTAGGTEIPARSWLFKAQRANKKGIELHLLGRVT